MRSLRVTDSPLSNRSVVEQRQPNHALPLPASGVGGRLRSNRRHVSIIVPTYREAQNLDELVVRITQSLLPCDIPFDILAAR